MEYIQFMPLTTKQFCLYRSFSYLYENGMGFKILYETSNVSLWTYRLGECGGNFSTPNGIFTSPSYPDNYPENVDCTYLISLPEGTYVNMTIIDMDISCWDSGTSDRIEFRDGSSGNSPLMGRWCGHGSQHLQTTQNYMRIR